MAEGRVELRSPAALYGLMLYAFSSCLLVYFANANPKSEQWVALYWLVQLFVGINAALKGFAPSQRGAIMWWYSLVPPRVYLLGKIVYNALLMLVLSWVVLGGFQFFFTQKIGKLWAFVEISTLTSLGLSTVLTFVSAIAYRAQNTATLMAVLAFPTLVPMLTMAIVLTRTSLSAEAPLLENILMSLALTDVVAFVAAMLLFPYLWRD
jgi:heme exporter protein B